MKAEHSSSKCCGNKPLRSLRISPLYDVSHSLANTFMHVSLTKAACFCVCLYGLFAFHFVFVYIICFIHFNCYVQIWVNKIHSLIMQMCLDNMCKYSVISRSVEHTRSVVDASSE